ncbi:hypothetical protein NPIL_157841 [Nephila pilipes]|uniref:Uncharacterized protein n=1 Tax=Nephila pilipes TaxID=299642 RepID=A0A8X6QHP6_NEPPI|nr:hypothetical protein NPIL_157841 [Nephila pilipes]
MLRNNRKLKDIPGEERLSLEILDNILDEFAKEYGEETSRYLEDIPVDVRHSLEILDDILIECGREETELHAAKAKSEIKDNRTLQDIPPAVSKSLEILDNVNEEIEKETNAPRGHRAVLRRTSTRRNRDQRSDHKREVHHQAGEDEVGDGAESEQVNYYKRTISTSINKFLSM